MSKSMVCLMLIGLHVLSVSTGNSDRHTPRIRRGAKNNSNATSPVTEVMHFSPPRQIDREETGEDDGTLWMYKRRAYPLGHIPGDMRANALKNFEQMVRPKRSNQLVMRQGSEFASASWNFIGPQLLG
jgi:hypothetical protein